MRPIRVLIAYRVDALTLNILQQSFKILYNLTFTLHWSESVTCKTGQR